VGAATLVLENFFGVAQQVISSEPLADAPEPAFESSVVWPRQAEDGILLTPSKTKVRWAGNLQPVMTRARAGEPIHVTLDVKLNEQDRESDTGIKVVLHWDRVTLFGGNWPSPKNSPMQLSRRNGDITTYAMTLGSLPTGKYEFAAHVLAKNDLWIRADAAGERNGRFEILPTRVFAAESLDTRDEGRKKVRELVVNIGQGRRDKARA
jgi:hypothetical protein